MNSPQPRAVAVAARNDRLIRHEYRQIAGIVDSPNRGSNPLNRNQILWRCHQRDFHVEGAVAIEKYSGASVHFAGTPRVTKASTVYPVE